MESILLILIVVCFTIILYKLLWWFVYDLPAQKLEIRFQKIKMIFDDSEKAYLPKLPLQDESLLEVHLEVLASIRLVANELIEQYDRRIEEEEFDLQIFKWRSTDVLNTYFDNRRILKLLLLEVETYLHENNIILVVKEESSVD